MKQMRQHGSFEARAAHNKSHHRRTMHDARCARTAQKQQKNRASRRFPRLVGAESAGPEMAWPHRAHRRDASRSTHRCVSRAKLSAYLANERVLINGSSFDREKQTHGHDRPRSPELVELCRLDESYATGRFRDGFVRSLVRRVLVERERGGETFIAALRQGPRRRQSIAPRCRSFCEFYALASRISLLYFSGIFKSRPLNFR